MKKQLKRKKPWIRRWDILVRSSIHFEALTKWITYFLPEFGGFNVCLIITSGFILANVILETFGISFVLPVSQCELNWTITERSILSSVAVIGIIISSHLWGYLADTKGRKRVILPTLILGFVFEFIGSFSNGFWMLATFKFLNGVL